SCSCFFCQAEYGIRDYKVTGVQTCALPICSVARTQLARTAGGAGARPCDEREVHTCQGKPGVPNGSGNTSTSKRARKSGDDRKRPEERRVGKGCGSRWVEDE